MQPRTSPALEVDGERERVGLFRGLEERKHEGVMVESTMELVQGRMMFESLLEFLQFYMIESVMEFCKKKERGDLKKIISCIKN